MLPGLETCRVRLPFEQEGTHLRTGVEDNRGSDGDLALWVSIRSRSGVQDPTIDLEVHMGPNQVDISPIISGVHHRFIVMKAKIDDDQCNLRTTTTWMLAFYQNKEREGTRMDHFSSLSLIHLHLVLRLCDSCFPTCDIAANGITSPTRHSLSVIESQSSETALVGDGKTSNLWRKRDIS
ncbi:hypothetical protein BHE74_00000531 [Ensete ventricosum]|nr:hypothetical protein GW17_00057292 [Ensete ventricosum]RWW90314.1 hypothetical protein BHE74_00000531 [Ensete ventricosum]RZR95675.1 hypothetical protein BHM03_00024541 [Ensete ventricosum]